MGVQVPVKLAHSLLQPFHTVREDRAVSAITILGCKEYNVFRCGECQKELIVRRCVFWDLSFSQRWLRRVLSL
jgi:hypothetical protein